MKFASALASLSLASLSPLVSAYTYGLGKSWLIGSGSTSNIVKVSTTFNPGVPPSGQTGSLILYPGLSNGTGDLLIISLESWPDQSWCGGTTGQWCIRTQVFSEQHSTFGQFVPLNANESLDLVFEQSSDGLGWTQSAVINDQVVSQLTSPSGPMTMFGVTTECDDDCAMTVSDQTYTNTIIELAAADPTWGSTATAKSEVYGGEGSANITGQQPTVVSGLSSADGKLWTVQEIMIPALDD